MILADENIDFSIINALRSSGINVYSIAESNSGITDEAVIALSLNPPKIILTEDKDFGEWVFAHQVRTVSVILLRYHFTETAKITAALIKLLSERNEDLFNKFTTISSNKVRIRTL